MLGMEIHGFVLSQETAGNLSLTSSSSSSHARSIEHIPPTTCSSGRRRTSPHSISTSAAAAVTAPIPVRSVGAPREAGEMVVKGVRGREMSSCEKLWEARISVLLLLLLERMIVWLLLLLLVLLLMKQKMVMRMTSAPSAAVMEIEACPAPDRIHPEAMAQTAPTPAPQEEMTHTMSEPWRIAVLAIPNSNTTNDSSRSSRCPTVVPRLTAAEIPDLCKITSCHGCRDREMFTPTPVGTVPGRWEMMIETAACKSRIPRGWMEGHPRTTTATSS